MMIGSTISHYRIDRLLGEGGMGKVYLAEDLRLRRPVALKLLREKDCPEEGKQDLLREARAASSLNHPNIAVIYDVDEVASPEGPMYLLAMEYVAGQTLAELASQRNLSLEEILDLMQQAAGGLAEAHARGVVHRDVKPSNLMVTSGRIKILDFGLAQVQAPNLEDAVTQTRGDLDSSAELLGTPHYMSPEQALGRPIDARSDVFSLGVVLYELLAGRRPFDGDNLFQLADAIVNREPPPFPARFGDPRLPELERLALRMLSKSVEQRPSSLREVVDTLTRLQSGSSIPAADPGVLTVAVVGFQNLTRHGEDEWLGTGLLETVTAALQGIDGVEVWSRDRLRESMRQLGFEDSELLPEDAVLLGRKIVARWVLAGAFQRLGDQVRVTARIVEVASGKVLRAVKEDGRVDGLFELQDRVVAQLASGLRRGVAAVHEGEETQVIAAYEALAKGLLNIRADTYESLDRAILFFERALKLDPSYIRAQIELGAALQQKADYLEVHEYSERAVTILRKVLEQRPRLPRVWRELGLSLLSYGRVDEAVDCLRHAMELAPDDPRVLGGTARAYFVGLADFPQAASLFTKAVERNPEAGWYWLQLAHCLALLRDFPAGERAARRAIELQAAFLSGQQGVQIVGAHMRLGHLQALAGDAAAAVESFRQEIQFVDHMEHALRSRIRVELQMRFGSACQQVGEAKAAETAFRSALEAFTERQTLGAEEPFTRYYAAATHALLGDLDPALSLLEASIRQSPAFMRARARIEPEWRTLRDHPRFSTLVGAES